MNKQIQFITLVIVGLMLVGCNQQEAPSNTSTEVKPRPAKIVPLIKTGIKFERTYPGTLEASQKADLAFRVSGQLIELPAVAGLEVKKGDLLAKIDPKDFDNTLKQYEARFDLAKTQMAQEQKLIEKNLSSQLKFDQVQSELKSAKAALEQAKNNLEYTELTAPFDGVVARVNIENFQPIQAQQTIIQLRHDKTLDIRFSVPETLLSQLKRLEDPGVLNTFCGQVTLVSHPNKQIRACHKEHETEPDPVTRNYQALFTLEPIKDFVALPGMTASIQLDFSPFKADQSKQIFYVPVEAVFAEGDQQWIWQVTPEMTVKKVAVSLGRIENNLVEITSDISPDTKIIAAGVSYIREGMLVKPLVKQRGL